MPIVKVGDKRIKFPDSMSQEEIGVALQSQFPSQQQAEPAQPSPERPQITGGRGIGGQRAQQQRFDEQQALEMAGQIESGQMSAADLSPEQVEAVRSARINAIPELSGISDKINFGEAMAAMTTFDPDEFGRILSKSDPDIGIVTTPDGQRIAVNNKTGAVMNINKTGPSAMDAVQLGAAALAFAPASRAATIPGLVAGGMGTQALIETAQEQSGGDFNVGDVALAGAAPVVANKATQALKSGIRQLKSRSPAAAQYLDDQLAPQSSQATDLAMTPIEQQQRNTSFLQQINTPVKESVKKAEIRQAIREGTKEAAGWTVNRRGQVVADPVGREAVRSGFDPRTVSTIKFGTQEDKAAMRQMLDMAEETLKSGTARVRNRPQKVIGDTVMKRFNVINDAKKQASKEIGEAANNQLKGRTVNIANVVDDFGDDLDSLGIQIDGDTLSFKGSQVEGNKATAAIRRVYDRLKTEDDGLSLHKLKQYIDSQINWEKSPDKPLDKQAVAALKRLREGINSRLKEESQDYANANANYSEAVGAINDFAKTMGRRFNPDDPRVGDLVGQELRKVLSNYGVRNDMISAIDQLDEVARKYGGNFSDDPLHQVVFYSDLERLLGSFADNSLQGVTEKAASVGLDLATGTPTGTAANLIRSGLNKALRPSEEKAIKSMRKLLNR